MSETVFGCQRATFSLRHGLRLIQREIVLKVFADNLRNASHLTIVRPATWPRLRLFWMCCSILYSLHIVQCLHFYPLDPYMCHTFDKAATCPSLEISPPPISGLPAVDSYHLQEAPCTNSQNAISHIPLLLDIHSCREVVHEGEPCYCKAYYQVSTAT